MCLRESVHDEEFSLFLAIASDVYILKHRLICAPVSKSRGQLGVDRICEPRERTTRGSK